MDLQRISSPHSPHVERVKALLGPRGKKERAASKHFVLEGRQALTAALEPHTTLAPKLENIYLTQAGKELVSDLLPAMSELPVFLVPDAIMKQMADTETPQGVLALCSFRDNTLHRFLGEGPKRIAYFWEMQDPGNCGTVIRSADAAGFDGVIFSTNSVDIFNPKTVRATAGSLWNIPVINDVPIEEILEISDRFALYAFDSHAERSLNHLTMPEDKGVVLIFGNEARGLPSVITQEMRLSIPMKGHTESMNVASAAAIAMYHFGMMA
jgi:RNA methyltransferase, TrmH family